MRTIKASYKYLEIHRLINQAKKSDEFNDLKVFYNNISEAKPFVVDDSLYMKEFTKPTKTIYLPFKTITFEFLSPHPLIDAEGDSGGWFKRFGYVPMCIGVILVENPDLSIDKALLLYNPENERDVWFKNFNYIPKDMFMHTYHFSNYEAFNKDVTNLQCLVYLLGQRYSVGETVGKFKVKKTGKLPELVKKLVVISDKREDKRVESIDGSPIDWKHQWRVRGHWRKIASNMLGKDREGQYAIVGNTWVKDFVKGDGPLIEKTRILKGEKQCQELTKLF